MGGVWRSRARMESRRHQRLLALEGYQSNSSKCRSTGPDRGRRAGIRPARGQAPAPTGRCAEKTTAQIAPRGFRSPLFANDLDQYALAATAVELAVKYLLPATEVEFARCNRDHGERNRSLPPSEFSDPENGFGRRRRGRRRSTRARRISVSVAPHFLTPVITHGNNGPFRKSQAVRGFGWNGWWSVGDSDHGPLYGMARARRSCRLAR
jgi:hypothetical protein